MQHPSTVYPRWRGEHVKCNMGDPDNDGLSPLARGTHSGRRTPQCEHRFIPAGAGNTQSHRPPRHPPTVYPRWRGEHAATLRGWTFLPGLSPLARGTPLTQANHDVQTRFIPAGAGNTAGSLLAWTFRPVYPRWRGEHAPRWSFAAVFRGLSPLARGTHVDIWLDVIARRFIPAGAGNTSGSCAARLSMAVYPRWRGEHATIPAAVVSSAGLSPLARGTRAGFNWPPFSIRFIPAGAGNTCRSTG
ncbi:Domain of uncharacterised function (DUF2825) [Serratia marcescens]|nr:Domain of uncharacterised function (DUF2825) [Serratia marcescens]